MLPQDPCGTPPGTPPERSCAETLPRDPSGTPPPCPHTGIHPRDPPPGTPGYTGGGPRAGAGVGGSQTWGTWGGVPGRMRPDPSPHPPGWGEHPHGAGPRVGLGRVGAGSPPGHRRRGRGGGGAHRAPCSRNIPCSGPGATRPLRSKLDQAWAASARLGLAPGLNNRGGGGQMVPGRIWPRGVGDPPCPPLRHASMGTHACGWVLRHGGDAWRGVARRGTAWCGTA